MNRQVEIRKSRSALYTAGAVAGIFTLFTILFLIYSEDTGGIGNFVFWIFCLPSVLGWVMVFDYMKSVMVISDQAVTVSGLLDKKTSVPLEEVSNVTTRKSFIFIYGEKNHVLASMEADLQRYPEAIQIFRDHEIPVEDRDLRKAFKKKSSV